MCLLLLRPFLLNICRGCLSHLPIFQIAVLIWNSFFSGVRFVFKPEQNLFILEKRKIIFHQDINGSLFMQEICKHHGSFIQQNSRSLIASLRSLQNAITVLHQDLSDVCSSNQYYLKYVCNEDEEKADQQSCVLLLFAYFYQFNFVPSVSVYLLLFLHPNYIEFCLK